MINTKQDYESPTTNVIFIKVHGILCQSTGEKFNDPENWPGIGDWNIL